MTNGHFRSEFKLKRKTEKMKLKTVRKRAQDP